MGVLYERHAQAGFRYLARRAGPVAGEDLLSEVFIAARSARTRVVGHHSGSALPWLYGIALNVLRRYFRHSQPAGAAEPGPGMDWDAVDARLDAAAQRRRLRTALCALSEPGRELLLLVAREGLTSAEAASVLGISDVAAARRRPAPGEPGSARATRSAPRCRGQHPGCQARGALPRRAGPDRDSSRARRRNPLITRATGSSSPISTATRIRGCPAATAASPTASPTHTSARDPPPAPRPGNNPDCPAMLITRRSG